jgi:hypothetical protein
LAITGSLSKGSVFIQSEVYGQPITGSATRSNVFGPWFAGPNLKSDHSLASTGKPWSKVINSCWNYTSSQSYRPIDTYESVIAVLNKRLFLVESYSELTYQSELGSKPTNNPRRLPLNKANS